MNINIKFIGTLHRITGNKNLYIELEKKVKIEDILILLVEKFPELKEDLINRSRILILLNGIDYKNLDGLNTQIIENSEITIVSTIHGG
ncbi:MoaD/ThiS family protein [Candidatus Bathyarchaeota archaeon]|nr:MoaD/ThiS family protein [Candidatus Bathyarchaeota archaeon]